MELIRVQEGELQVGSKLQWPVYDEHRRLLLQQGMTISSQRQLESLQLRGMYRSDETGNAKPNAATPPLPDNASPFDRLDDLIRRTGQVLRQLSDGNPEAVPRVTQLAEQLSALYQRWPDALLGAVHLCHEQPYVDCHPVHCSILSLMLAKALRYDEARCKSLVAAALTENLSILALQSCLIEQAEPLDEMQRSAVHNHPEQTAALLSDLGVTDPLWLQIVRQHHETATGSGYPGAITGEVLCQEAQILHLCDRYSAMVSGRSYRVGLAPGDALKRIYLGREQEGDESLRLQFIQELGIYPPGDFVQLNTGELGVVIKRGASSLTPVVATYQAPRGALYGLPFKRDCVSPNYEIRQHSQPEPGLRLNLNLLWNVG
jgi:HD-GYP domain-containing protein (c-di-GMP phosphodiesterase class II)